MLRAWFGGANITLPLTALLLLALPLGAAVAQQNPTPADLRNAKKIWHTLTPDEQAAYTALAVELSRKKNGGFSPSRVPGNDCASATLEMADLPLSTPIIETTVGRGDDLNLTAGAGFCLGGGPEFATTGLGPDIVYRVSFNTDPDPGCTMIVTMDPTDDGQPGTPEGPDDLALYIIQHPGAVADPPLVPPCAELSLNCVQVDDAGDAGALEEIEFTALVGNEYYIVVDGFNGDEGPFELDMREINGGTCTSSTPVRLQSFTVD